MFSQRKLVVSTKLLLGGAGEERTQGTGCMCTRAVVRDMDKTQMLPVFVT